MLGSNRRTLEWAATLRKRGFWVHPIRPPTVPQGTARLRITVTATHTAKEISAVVDTIAELAVLDQQGEPR